MTYLQPLFPLLLLLTVLSAIWGRRSSKPWLVAAPAIALFLVSWPPVAYVALWPYEAFYNRQPPVDRNVHAIVVLSSGVFPPYPPLPAAVLGSDTYERCQYAAWLHKHWLGVPVLATGGGSSGSAAYAITMSEALRREGVPPSLVWTEERSRSTFENAMYSAELLRSKGITRIALVTEAYHMLRAEKCFRKQGIQVVPAPCGFREDLRFTIRHLTPTWEAISFNEETLHESIGLLWYAMRGRV